MDFDFYDAITAAALQGDTAVIDVIKQATDFHDAESCATTVLNDNSFSDIVIETALQNFLVTRVKSYGEHGYWVHSLSHFTRQLWERRMTKWIARYNEIAFEGVEELYDSNCSNRLIIDFGDYALWSDDPADFHLNGSFVWMDWKHAAYERKRIEAGVFKSESDFLIWQIAQPEKQMKFDYTERVDLVNTALFVQATTRLLELGMNSEAEKVKQQKNALLRDQIATLEQLKTDPQKEWQEERRQKALEITRNLLGD